MFNFIKIEDNIWLNVNYITSIEYYPYGYRENYYTTGYYLLIHTVDGSYKYDNKEEAMGIIEKLRERGVFLE